MKIWILGTLVLISFALWIWLMTLYQGLGQILFISFVEIIIIISLGFVKQD